MKVFTLKDFVNLILIVPLNNIFHTKMVHHFPNFNFFRNGHETVTEFLLSKAANVNYVNDDGYTALIYATESGQGHIVEVFLTFFCQFGGFLTFFKISAIEGQRCLHGGLLHVLFCRLVPIFHL